MTIGDKIKIAREQKKMSQDELARKLGYKSRSTIAKIESGENELTQSKIKKFAAALEVSISWLMDFDIPNISSKYVAESAKNYIPIHKKKIPLLGTIAAGQPIYADEHIEEYLPVDDDLHADFALKVSGDSMINADINDGDIVFIKKQDTVENGQIAAVLIDDSATLKRFYKIGSVVQLQAENPKYAPIICSESNCDNCRIIGLAVAVLHRI